MAITINGTTGLAGVDGSAGTPAVQGADANTGIFFPAADTIAFAEGGTEVARFDSSGNLGIGVTPSYRLEVKGPAATAGQLSIHDGTGDTTVSGNNAASLLFQCRDSSVRTIAEIDGVHTTTNGTGGAMVFQTRISDTLAERMRIDSSGNLLVGSTSSFNSGKQCLAFSGATHQGFNIKNNADNPSDIYVGFYNAFGTNTGAIRSGGSTTSYVTSSDYRLKENVQPLVNALDKVMALRPVSYTWKSGGEDNGFIAHELQLILPKAVSGEKDAVNEDDTINPQGVDYSKIVTTLTAAIQEQQALITQLQADVAALKGATA